MSEILDSGSRRTFNTGAVRDIQEGKGLPSLMPLEIIPDVIFTDTAKWLSEFQKTGGIPELTKVLSSFCDEAYDGCFWEMFLYVAHRYEDGLQKYGKDNWKKGIPASCYLDSMCRHYWKYEAGWSDEPHDEAFVWNVMSCMWTLTHKPEMNDLAPSEDLRTHDRTEDDLK